MTFDATETNAWELDNDKETLPKRSRSPNKHVKSLARAIVLVRTVGRLPGLLRGSTRHVLARGRLTSASWFKPVPARIFRSLVP